MGEKIAIFYLPIQKIYIGELPLLDINPNRKNHYLLKGKSYLLNQINSSITNSSEFEQGLIKFDDQIKLFSKDVDIYLQKDNKLSIRFCIINQLNLSKFLNRFYQYEVAIECCDNSISINPNHHFVLINKVKTFFNIGFALELQIDNSLLHQNNKYSSGIVYLFVLMIKYQNQKASKDLSLMKNLIKIRALSLNCKSISLFINNSKWKIIIQFFELQILYNFLSICYGILSKKYVLIFWYNQQKQYEYHITPYFFGLLFVTLINLLKKR